MPDLKSLFGIFVGAILGIWCAWGAIQRYRVLKQASAWRAGYCRILESLVLPNPKVRDATALQIRYEFMVSGCCFEGTRARLGGDIFWSNRARLAFSKRFPPGVKIPVYYNLQNPAECCLERDLAGPRHFAVLATFFWVIAGVLLWLERAYFDLL